MTRRLHKVIATLLGGAFVVALISACVSGEGGDAGLNMRFPDVPLAGLADGTAFSLNELHGKVVLVNFWATWCTPCRTEMSSLQHLSDAAGGRFQVIGISLDEDPNLAREFVRDRSLRFHNVTQRSTSRLQDTLDIRALPETMVVDAAGVVRARIHGARDWASRETMTLLDKWISTPFLH